MAHGWWFPQSPQLVNKIPLHYAMNALAHAEVMFLRAVSHLPVKLRQVAVPGAKVYSSPEDAKISACSSNG